MIGSTAIPLVRRLLAEEFGRPVRLVDRPREATALGAAVLAAAAAAAYARPRPRWTTKLGAAVAAAVAAARAPAPSGMDGQPGPYAWR